MIDAKGLTGYAISTLIEKAKASDSADAALKFSQAACNVANVWACVSAIIRQQTEENTG